MECNYMINCRHARPSGLCRCCSKCILDSRNEEHYQAKRAGRGRVGGLWVRD